MIIVCQHCKIPIIRNGKCGRLPKWCEAHREGYQRRPSLAGNQHLRSPKRLLALKLKEEGLNLQQIANQLGITKQRIQQYFSENQT